MKYLLFLIAGLVIGISGTLSYTNYSTPINIVELSGEVKTPHPSLTLRYPYLYNSYIQNPVISSKEVYLSYENYNHPQRIKDGKVTILGELRTKKLDENKTATEIRVISFKRQD